MTEQKIPLLATGLNGLVGSRFAQDFAETYDFTNLDVAHPTQPTDITQADQVLRAFEASPAQFVIHLAAFTDVTAAWQQRDDKTGLAYLVNVVGTQNVVKAAEQTGKHVIHVSTAFVFDGEKDGLYTEDDQPHPIEWYGQTKAEAETVVQASSAPWTILRIDFPFRSDPFPKPDIVRKTLTNISNGIPLFDDHYFGPSYINDVAKVFDWVIRTQASGLFQCTTGVKVSDYELGKMLQELHQLPGEVKAGKLADYLAKVNRPYQRNSAMDTTKLAQALDFKLASLRDALSQVEL
jgi:dTDP-4-dehydrorhamnose reductase